MRKGTSLLSPSYFFFPFFQPRSTPRFLRRGPSKWCVLSSLGGARTSLAPCDSRWVTRSASSWATARPKSMARETDRERRIVAALSSLALFSMFARCVSLSLGQRRARSPRLFLAFPHRRQGSRAQDLPRNAQSKCNAPRKRCEKRTLRERICSRDISSSSAARALPTSFFFLDLFLNDLKLK